MPGLNYLTQRALRAEFAALRDAYVRPAYLDKLALIIPNGPHSARFPFLTGISSGMRERTGSGSHEQAILGYFDVKVDEFEDGVVIPEKDMRRDELGMISREVILGDLADSDNEHWEELVMDLVDDLATTEGYDGSNFFATNHSDDDGQYTTNQSNQVDCDLSDYPAIKSGSKTEPSAEDLIWSIRFTLTAMRAFRNAHGKYVNRRMKSICVVIPETFLLSANLSFAAGMIGYGTDNPMQAMLKAMSLSMDVELISDPRVSWTDRIGIFRTDQRRKAMAGLEEALPAHIAMKIYDASNSEKHRRQEIVEFERRANRKAAVGDWRLACQGILV